MIAFKKPFDGKLDHVLNLVTDCAYLLMYITFLSLHLTEDVPENEKKRSNLGYFMIALILLIILRCFVDLVVSLVDLVKYIIKFCRKSCRVAPQPRTEKIFLKVNVHQD